MRTKKILGTILLALVVGWTTIGPGIFAKPLVDKNGRVAGYIVIADTVVEGKKIDRKVEWQRDFKSGGRCYSEYKIGDDYYRLEKDCGYLRE